MSKLELTNEQLLNVKDPLTLSEKDFNRWNVLHKRARTMNKMSMDSLKEQVEYEELKARLAKAHCEARTSMVNTMKASITAMEIHEDYQKAEKFHRELLEAIPDPTPQESPSLVTQV